MLEKVNRPVRVVPGHGLTTISGFPFPFYLSAYFAIQME